MVSDSNATQEGLAVPGAKQEVYRPELPTDCPVVHLWGTRGSSPVTGSGYLRHGGNTSCVEYRYGGERIILDAGTGIRGLGKVIVAEDGLAPIHLFITHSHWDHVQGFPFFLPAYEEGREVNIYGAAGFGRDLEALFRGQLHQDYFPVQLDDMKADLRFHHLSDDAIEIGDLRVTWEAANHPGVTVGYKVEGGGKTVVYFPDNEFLEGYLGAPDVDVIPAGKIAPYQPFIDFVSGTDLLIHEGQFPNDEYEEKTGWGHSSLSNVCVLTKLAGVKHWVVVHHDPEHDDDFLQHKLNLTRCILEEIGHDVFVIHGFDGMERLLIGRAT